MTLPRIRRALISVYDKIGIVDFARALVDEFGIEIISTGGTAKLLKESGIPVTLVEEVTGFPEMLDGRVKTLHPKIHAAILADRDNPEHMGQLEEQGIKPIDMVVVNLYPFEKTVADPNCKFEDAIEMIDIGGPCMLRAAAKNHRHVIPVVRPQSLEYALGELRGSGELSETGRIVLASIAFEETSAYDARVDDYLTKRWTDLRCGPSERIATATQLADLFHHRLEKTVSCRYGENPHQISAVYGPAGTGKQLWKSRTGTVDFSFNNCVDTQSALELCQELARSSSRRHVAAFVKHTNACGVGVCSNAQNSYQQAYFGDPNAAMGGILACSFPVDTEFASVVMDTYSRWGKEAGAGGFFVEVWIAPEFAEDAVYVIRTSKPWGERVRLLSVGDMSQPPNPEEREYKSITGGMLVQTRDLVGLNEEQWKVITRRAPSESEMTDLRLAWLIAKHTKSNAISICKDGMLIGNGAGQMSRVMSCRIATWLAKENGHAEKLPGSVAASDAFFPFADGPKLLIDAGVTALIQPGGSKRDEDTIKLCDERGVAMIHTGTRHFKH